MRREEGMVRLTKHVARVLCEKREKHCINRLHERGQLYRMATYVTLCNVVVPLLGYNEV